MSEVSQRWNDVLRKTTETAMTFVHIRQGLQGRGARFEQLRTEVNAHLTTKMNAMQTEVENTGVRLPTD